MIKFVCLPVLFAVTLLTSASGFASVEDLNSFFKCNVGTWVGTGVVTIQINGRSSTYKLNVQQTVTATAEGAWSTSTLVKGMPHDAPATIANFEITESGLTLDTTQYASVVTIQTSTPTELKFSTSHTDPVSGASSRLTRDMVLLSPTSLRLTSDVVAGNGLRQHFVYNLSLKH